MTAPNPVAETIDIAMMPVQLPNGAAQAPLFPSRNEEVTV